MDCASCANTIKTALGRLPGIDDIRISVTNETLALKLDRGLTPEIDIERQISQLGYRPERVDRSGPATRPAAEEPARAWWSQPKGRIALTAGLLVVLAYGASLVIPQAAYLIFVAATLIAAAPISRRAIVAAMAGAPFTIEMLMTIAVLGALIIGAAEEAAIVVFLFSVGEVLEGVAASRARAGIRALANLVPQTAMLETGGALREVPAASLIVGQIVVVRPGDRVPADGTVEDGFSSVDEAPITGESVPKAKEPGEDVFAGSINQDAALRVRVEKAAGDNMIARIVTLVEEAQEAQAPTERFIDRFSRIYMPFIVALSALVAVVPPLAFGGAWDEWIYKGLTLLLIGCPCALVISVPAAIASSLSAGARHGLLIKGGVIIEKLAGIRTVALDKTGTLTEGRPEVTDVIALSGADTALLATAGAVEAHSNHPLAKAIVARAAAVPAAAMRDATAVRAVPGKGMEGRVGLSTVFIGAPRFAAEKASLDAVSETIARLENDGKTTVVVTIDGAVAGVIALRDQPRPGAAAGIAALKELGVGAVMLTGDNARTGAAIGRVLGLEARADMLPADKADVIKAMAAEGPVAMVGDGINDAPALASAQVGIAMGSGTDVALEAADAALLKNDVGGVAKLIGLARATMANIRQNIAIALGLKALFLVTTIMGATGLWMAVIADTGGTVLVTLNALRLLGHFRDRNGDGAPTVTPS
ncbi:heavy metal translocating P-type ATPase [Chelatococcus asaccharovorans]|uniref:heavy metal translocating P-type ATPase n=1 Tax=Chelatococcus asaccharovorans TaxID=28210 RepID=UPI00224C70F9|nr:heavy metal translocating P-type ATPase [Chelatococcus asaccharovorans]CAH1653879.1 Zinc/cadmium/lead-transporting P-type ATPase [Chelatococcus asaccharovorans]CAH1685911.1 Zinc/cadmium/lead-transporting P-type ATPase [Chelatococcus asaccharovorans]